MSVVRLARRMAFQVLSPSGVNFSEAGAAHNYELEVFIEGAMNETSGMVTNIRDLDRLVGEILIPFDGKRTEMNSGALAVYLFEKIRPCVASLNGRLIKLRLIENPDLWFDVWN